MIEGGKNWCDDLWSTVMENRGEYLVYNPNGSISIYLPNGDGILTPRVVSEECCLFLNGSELVKGVLHYDLDAQTCMWKTKEEPEVECAVPEQIKIILNTKEEDGTLYSSDINDNCSLRIDFDYLFKLKCESLNNLVRNQSLPRSILRILESINLTMSLEIIENDDLVSVDSSSVFSKIGSGNMYDYLTIHPNNSGFFISPTNSTQSIIFNELTFTGETTIEDSNPNVCSVVKLIILRELFDESGLVTQSNGESVFNKSLASTIMGSTWLNHSTLITDQAVIRRIENKKIKLSLTLNDSYGEFCVLIDNISINKECVQVEREDILITESPGFNLTRVIDNKKSWVDGSSDDREFEIKNVNNTEVIRITDYVVPDDRLIINSKEIDLDINIAKAIEYDVWKSILNNPCILNPEISTDTCNNEVSNKGCGDYVDFNNLVSINFDEEQSLSKIREFFSKELIDVKNRQTINSYATLRTLYDRYNNNNECGVITSGFNYYTIEEFAKLMGDYWVDLIEQVIPSTTIWGSVKIYGNTIFDQQKFTYKQSTLFSCVEARPSSGCNLVLNNLNLVNECLGNLLDTFIDECP